MEYMSYKIVKSYVPSSKYDVKCPYAMTPIGITVHNTANDASAKNEVAYMKGNNNQVSYHAAIDDKCVVLAIPFSRNAWHAGDGGSGKGNRKTIGIEICYSKSGGAKFDKAETNAAAYIAKLLKQYGWTTKKVYRHYDWSGKDCPHRTMDKGWSRFIKMIQKELDKLNKKADTTTKKEKSAASTFKPYKVKITCKTLNVRAGAGTKYKVVTTVKKNEVYTIVDEKKVGSATWGKLKSGVGWIHLGYTKKV